MSKGFLIAGLSAAAMFVPVSSASAFYCTVANKPVGAGAVDFSKFKETRGGNVVAPGAFADFGGGEIMIRGGDGHSDKTQQDPGFQSFGAANPNAIANGPADHGVIEAE